MQEISQGIFINFGEVVSEEMPFQTIVDWQTDIKWLQELATDFKPPNLPKYICIYPNLPAVMPTYRPLWLVSGTINLVVLLLWRTELYNLAHFFSSWLTKDYIYSLLPGYHPSSLHVGSHSSVTLLTSSQRNLVSLFSRTAVDISALWCSVEPTEQWWIKFLLWKPTVSV